MRKSGLMVLLATAVIPGALAAQHGHQAPNERVVSVIATRYEPPGCSIKAGHFKVSSAGTYLKSAYEAGERSNRDRLLRDADRVLQEAIKENGQEGNGAAWYYMGRVNLMQGDLRGADSAFTRAESLLPECKADITEFRRRASMALVNPAGEMFKADKPDSAQALYRQSLIISREFPTAYYNMGIIFTNADRADSATWYFAKAAEVAAADPRFAELRNQATFNVAAMYQRTDRHADAVTSLRKYLEWVPNDAEAKKALAQSLRATGKADEAQQIEQQMLAAGAATGQLSSNDMMSMGVNLFNDKKYAEAAEAFQKVVDQSPHDRFAWFNLANAYLALKDGPKLVAAAQKLVEMDPLNEDNLKLLGEGYRFSNKQDELIATVTKLVVMPTSISVESFSHNKGGAKLAGTATGRPAQTVAGKDLPPAAVTVTVEFINAQGVTVTTQELAIPALAAAAKHPFTLEATGEGIVGWRYKEKK